MNHQRANAQTTALEELNEEQLEQVTGGMALTIFQMRQRAALTRKM